MNLHRIGLSTIALLLCCSPAAAGTVSFDFNNGTDFDNAGSGVAMIATNGTDTVTMTLVDILAPEYSGTTLTGNTLSAANGDGVTTNVETSLNAIGVNNGSINNANFQAAGGPGGSSNESANFNVGESWVVNFDQDVVLSLFNFSSLSAGDAFDVTVEDFGTISFGDSGSADDYTDPFSGYVVPAGKNVTFSATGTLGATDIRITQIDVDTAAVPEPTSVALLTVMCLGLSCRRSRLRA